MSLYKRILGFVKDALAPAQCLGCGVFGTWACADCRAMIHAQPVPLSNYPYLDGVTAVARYEGAMREMIHAFKYEGLLEIGSVLSEMAVRNWEGNPGRYVVTAVPLHPARQRTRGFNQAELVAKDFATAVGVEYLPLLSKKVATKAQADLTRRERLSNVADIFESNYSLWGSRILLIDDVLTTGSTMSECAKALKAAGADRVYGLVLSKV